jgi:hypothetical protein
VFFLLGAFPEIAADELRLDDDKFLAAPELTTAVDDDVVTALADDECVADLTTTSRSTHDTSMDIEEDTLSVQPERNALEFPDVTATEADRLLVCCC